MFTHTYTEHITYRVWTELALTYTSHWLSRILHTGSHVYPTLALTYTPHWLSRISHTGSMVYPTLSDIVG